MSAGNVVALWPWIDHPRAGRALMVARQWLLTIDTAERVDAFDLLQYCVRLTSNAAPGEMLSMLADEGPETAAAALGVALKLIQLERLEEMATVMGVSVQLQLQHEALKRAFPAKGGDE